MKRYRNGNLRAGVIACAVFLFMGVAGCGVSPDVSPLKQGGKHKARQESATAAVPGRLPDETVDGYVARLDDGQARRVLVEQLQSRAMAPEKKPGDDFSGFAGAVLRTHEITHLLETRWRELASGVRASPEFLPAAYAEVRGRGGTPLSILFRFSVGLAVLLGTGTLCEWLFRRATRGVRARLSTPDSTSLAIKLKSLGLLGAIETGAVCVFVLSTLVVFLPLDNQFRRLLLLAYLGAVLLWRIVELATRFFLVPHAPALRWIHLSDAASSVLYRWISWTSLAAAAGLLVSVFMELERTDESMVILTRVVTGLVVVLMVVAAMVWNRESVSASLRTPDGRHL